MTGEDIDDIDDEAAFEGFLAALAAAASVDEARALLASARRRWQGEGEIRPLAREYRRRVWLLREEERAARGEAAAPEPEPGSVLLARWLRLAKQGQRGLEGAD